MKRLALVIVLVVPAAAFAQPALTPPSAPSPEPQYFLAPSLELGGTDPGGAVFAGIAIDGGYRLSGDWWLHGKGLIARSNASTWGDQKPTGNLDTLGAGFEWRHRWFIAGMDGVLVRDNTKDPTVAEYDGAGLAGHVGLELGFDRVRFRPEMEFLMGGRQHVPGTIIDRDYETVGLSLGVAFTW